MYNIKRDIVVFFSNKYNANENDTLQKYKKTCCVWENFQYQMLIDWIFCTKSEFHLFLYRVIPCEITHSKNHFRLFSYIMYILWDFIILNFSLLSHLSILVSFDGSSKLTFFSKHVTRAIPNFLTQSRCIHSGSYFKTSIPAQLNNIIRFQKLWKKTQNC